MARKRTVDLKEVQKAGNAVADRLGLPKLTPHPICLAGQMGSPEAAEELLDKLYAKPKPPPKRRSRPLEASILRACYRWLVKQAFVVLVERRTNIAMDLGSGRFIRSGVKGRADLWCVLDTGTHVEIECKQPGRGLSRPQRLFRDYCQKMGLSFVVVHSLKELKEFFQL